MKRHLPPLVFLFLLLWPGSLPAVSLALPATASKSERLVQSAIEQVGVTTLYDPAYVPLAYPLGDVPLERGVCTDVVIRALRKLGMDLQQKVHEDMRKHFSQYPRNWGLKKPDRNIDHRRVPNLMCWFKRHEYALLITDRPADYRAGDIVAWALPDNRPHIGIVTHLPVPETDRLLCVHNIGGGAQLEDVLFVFRIIGHYRLFP